MLGRHSYCILLLLLINVFLRIFFSFFFNLKLWHPLLLFDMYKEKPRTLFSYISALTAFLFNTLQSAILHFSKVQLFVN